MTITRSFLRPVLLSLGLALAACNDSSSDKAAPAPLTVSPSLGVVRDADVRILALDGRELASGRVDASGRLALQVGGLGNGFIVELSGNNEATYFDEGANGWRALPAGTVLHAASADGRGAVAVTALTEIAYRRAVQLAGGGALAATHIRQANAELAEWLARVPVSIGADGSQVLPGSTPDILAPALPVDGPAALGSGTAAGRYAILLASLAQQAFAGAAENADPCAADVACSPLLPVIATLATDFADGVLDDKNPHGGSRGLPFIDPDVSPVDVFQESPPSEDLTPQQEVGREFPGTYKLSCAGQAAPATMVIESSGALTLTGPLGSYVLPVDDVTLTSPLVEYGYHLTPTGKAFTARLVHMESGAPDYQIVRDIEINGHVDGSVKIVQGDTTTECSTTFSHGTAKPPIPYFTDLVVGTHFYCLANGTSGIIEVAVDLAPTTWSIDGVVQPQKHADMASYHHITFKQTYQTDKVATYEHYQWGEEGSPDFFTLSRAMLRYEVPVFNVFDMGAGEYIQGPGNCYAERPADFDYVVGPGSIMLNFGETSLTL